MDIVKEDISGLVAVVIKFGNEEEALKQANDTQYGLVAAVFTKDITHGIQFSQKFAGGHDLDQLRGLCVSECAVQRVQAVWYWT